MTIYSFGMQETSTNSCIVHAHDSWEIVLNLSGSGTEEIDGQSWPFREGTILCIPPRAVHVKYSEEGFRDAYFHISEGPVIAGHIAEKPVLLQDDANRSFEQLIYLMRSVQQMETSGSYAVLGTLAEAALQMIDYWLMSQPLSPVTEKVRAEIASSFSNPDLKIRSVLSGHGYAVDHVRRLFHAEMHMTPNEYLTVRRINYARQLMDQNEILHLQLADIALMCGYYDAHYFSRTFKKITGITPSEYLQLPRDTREQIFI